MKHRTFALVGLAAALASGCAAHTGGSSMVPAAPSYSNARAPRTAPVPNAAAPRTPFVDITQVFHRVRLRHPNLPRLPNGSALTSSIAKLRIEADLRPSYASVQQISFEYTIPVPKKGTITSLTVPFKNAPAGNNEFATFEVNGLSGDGAQYFLGDLAAIVNVAGATKTNVVANAQTTLIFQAEMAVIDVGFLSASDLKSPGLSAKVAARIKTLKLKPSPSTGLFTTQQLDGFLQGWAPAWRRTLRFKTGPRVDRYTITNDPADMAENILAWNEGEFFDGDLDSFGVAGMPCFTNVDYGILGKKVRIAPQACVDPFYVRGGNDVTQYVYGGPIIVGQVDDQGIPYKGSIVHLPDRAPGSTKDLGPISLVSAQREIRTNDPFDWAFGTRPQLYEGFTPGPSLVQIDYSDFEYEPPTGWSAVNPGLPVLTWNPAGLPPSEYRVCTWRSICIPLNSKKTLAIEPPYYDPGTYLPYFNYAGNGVTVSAEPSGGCTATTGYHLAYTGTSFSIKTTKPTWLAPGDEIYFLFDDASGCTPDPMGMKIALTAVGTDGKTYTNSGVNNATYPDAEIVILATSVARPTPIKSLTLTFHNAPANALDLEEVFNGAEVEDSGPI